MALKRGELFSNYVNCMLAVFKWMISGFGFVVPSYQKKLTNKVVLEGVCNDVCVMFTGISI